MQLIIDKEKNLISENIQDIEIKISTLKSKLKSLDKSTPFTDALSQHFYGGMVGYMNKKDNAKKSRELEKFVSACNSEKKIEAEILSLEKKLKKLNTGNYLMRPNGLIVESYSLLSEKLEALNTMIKTGKIKDKKATGEELNILREMRKETRQKINQRKKA